MKRDRSGKRQAVGVQARSRPRNDIDLLPGDDLPDFQFSQEQWHAIAGALPPGIRDKPDSARRWLERLGRSYRGQFSYPSDPRRRSKNWTNVAKLSTRLAEAIRTARRYPNYLEGLVLLLEDLATVSYTHLTLPTILRV